MRSQLHAAIVRCHGSHTAKWLTETARACLNHGLTSTGSGLQLAPVEYHLLQQHLMPICELMAHDLESKLIFPTGLKYFRLVGPGNEPSNVLLRLSDIIFKAPPDIAALVSSIQIKDTVAASNGAQPVHISQPPGFGHSLTLPKNLDPTPKAAAGADNGHASKAFDASHSATQLNVRMICTCKADKYVA